MTTTLLTRGSIHTMDPACPRASAVAIDNGRILAVGEDLDLPGATRIDLGGRCVLPGLTDSHIHLRWAAITLQMVDLGGCRSLEEMLARVAARAAQTPPGEWLSGHSWNQEEWHERRFPTAADLDRVAPHCPTALTAKSGHVLAANSAAMAAAGITAETLDPPGGRIGRDASGQPDGLFFEEAMSVILDLIPQPEPDALAAALQPVFAQAWRFGLTAAHDVDNLAAFDAFQRLRAEDKLGLRVVKYLPAEALDHALALRLRAGLGDDWLRIGGIKLFADGALGPRTAAMLAPYEGEPDNLGILTVEREALEETVRRAAAGGLPVAIHAIGDAANRMVLDVFAAVRPTHPTLRQRIEHVQLLHPDDISRLAEPGVVASMQPLHATQDAVMADRYWGARAATAYAWRSLLDAGAVLAFGSDCPVESPNPFLGIHAAVTRTRADGYGGPDGWQPQQRLTVAEAIRAYTWGAAYAVGLEKRLGSLSPGKWADLVVVDRDPFTCEPAAIAGTQVVGTMIGGEWVYRRF